MSEESSSTKKSLKQLKHKLIHEKIKDAITHDFKIEDLKIAMVKLLTTRGSVRTDVCEQLLSEDVLERIKVAFTHPTMMENENYELYETMGDATINKCIVWYLIRRFPTIKQGQRGNEIITELKKKFVNKASFASHLVRLNLESFIRYKELYYMEKGIEKKILMDNSMKEDVFESLLGVLEDIIDSKIMVNTGYSVIYNIVSSLLDDIRDIDISIEGIVDSKTKIFEIMSTRKKYGDSMVFKSEKTVVGDRPSWESTLTLTFKGDGGVPGPTGHLVKTFKGMVDMKVSVSELDAANKALEWLDQKYGIKWSRASSSLSN